MLTLLRVSVGAAALLIIFYPPWLARPLERQIALMGTLFEDGFVNSSTREKIRLIVLVTMVALWRRTDPVPTPVPAGARLSPDGYYWWDGTGWRSVR